ncbi:hypothetical protein EXIGLDRAFT_775439 [Exidia glandulosa HHB12029]|uniref:Uncharacterized protein n=1 Tax=Exidia glandulosa HHB12029 TaxID=1314781 RepID=A0A165DWV1_EXIGL|nr:hypothetical protein EXIGLDRAFT_775439 [Exidia glandulosa HHB12029]
METASLPKARLPRLTKVQLAGMHPNWCCHILGALDAPSLLDIDLEVEYRYGTSDDGLCAFFVPTPRMPWRFPSVTTLRIWIGEYSSGYMPNLAAGLDGHGWISNAVLDVIVDVLCDGSVAPNLRQLSTIRCTTRSKSERRLEATKPPRLERNASETAVYLNDKRSSISVDAKLGKREGLGAVEDIDDEEMSDAGETRLEVEFSDCELCEDENLDESTRSDSI